MELEFFDALREAGVTEQQARAAVESLSRELDRRWAVRTDDLATRADLDLSKAAFKSDTVELKAELKADVAELRTELKADMAELRAEVKADVAELRTEVKADVAEVKADIAKVRTEMANLKVEVIKWVAGLLIAQSAIIGALFKLLAQ